MTFTKLYHYIISYMLTWYVFKDWDSSSYFLEYLVIWSCKYFHNYPSCCCSQWSFFLNKCSQWSLFLENVAMTYILPTVFSIWSSICFYYSLQVYGVSSKMGEYCAHAVCVMDTWWVVILSLLTHLFLGSEAVPSFFYYFCRRRLFHLPNLRSMLAKNIGEQQSTFALKMGRACLICWEHARELPSILWRRPFKILFVLHVKKNILHVKGVKVSFASVIRSHCFLFISKIIVLITILCAKIKGK